MCSVLGYTINQEIFGSLSQFTRMCVAKAEGTVLGLYHHSVHLNCRFRMSDQQQKMRAHSTDMYATVRPVAESFGLRH